MIQPPYPWQQQISQHLAHYIDSQRIPQALLFSGVQGIGKKQLAEVYAAAIVCQTPDDGAACGICHACQLLAANTHPDYILIEPEEPGKAIGIDKIRQLIGKLALKPQYERYRVVIIQPAHALNTASANAFLKCLEEPTERTCLILLSEFPARLPATIRSRCQQLQCHRPEPQSAINWLQAQGVNNDAEQLLKMAQGAPLLAKQYADKNFIELRKEYFDSWLQLAHKKIDPLPIADQWQKQDNVDLPVLLNWIAGWLKDIVKLTHGIPAAQIDNPDFAKSLQALAKSVALSRLYGYYDKLLQHKIQANTQVNKQLLLEQLLIDWYQLRG